MTVPLGLPGLSIQPGDHICAFHRGASARQDILTDYLRVGLSSGDNSFCRGEVGARRSRLWAATRLMPAVSRA
jgi:hypothetical protein